ncbi:phosphatidylinositol-glycan biosynthesis class S protein [Halteromyces radiatus]|uniref:phosphatidylinositol-glycan biosynthesis class S protein n=1 Tax=Halteromyces radiatus TaxID=101107 RepID=UPI002220E533|nr:phosphatidylinositol-glycan biosynthesis class S protein [Halteromyces radiatus]KAI8081673.1 phosphatidylinositol-glycan biosynthesis class S protein [Halteromyces radiatus]
MKDTTQMVIFAFWFVVLLGVPFWWKTTEVYRAHLPFDEIDSLQTRQESMFILPTTLSLFVPATWLLSLDNTSGTIHSLETSLEYKLSEKFHDVSFCAKFPFHVQLNSWSTDDLTLESINALLQQQKDSPIGQYSFYFHSSNIQQSKSPQKHDQINVIIGKDRTSVIQLSKIDQDTLNSVMISLIPAIFKTEFEAIDEIASCSSGKVDKYDANNMRTFKYSSRYQITFSLMNNNPRFMAIDWDIRDAAKRYLYPLLNELSDVSNFTVDSQIQNYAPLSQSPHYMEREKKPNYYYFKPEQLPHFVNSADWNLASSISSYPTINFILYVPSADVTPLRIHDQQGHPLLSNSFLIPRWGGVTIKNPPKYIESKYSITKSDLKPIMKIFISQLRGLMGIQDISSSAAKLLPSNLNTTFMLSTQTGITTLEKDNLIRRRTMENMINAISTLRSLGQLVMEIPNMVVLDHIQSQVRQSLTSIQSVRIELEKGNYGKALKHSVDAMELSEMAFFDPTMVSMLYFPDEHKYAIYMPLFVPISVPLSIALLKSLKKWRKNRFPSSLSSSKTKSE